MRAWIAFLAAAAALFVPMVGLGSATAAAPLGVEQARMLVGSWDCETTRADGLVEKEKDQIEQIGNGSWLHGTSRPDGDKSEPYYDFYVGYTGSNWVYIQIYPSAKFFFVGTSDGNALSGSSWHIVYPTREEGYRFYLSDGSFTIDYPDLTQFCKKTSSQTIPAPAPAPLVCSTWLWENGHGGKVPGTESLTISKPQPGVPWWQGVAKTPSGEVVYAYNLFDLQSKRLSVLVNPTSNSYAIAVGAPTHDLDGSLWMVVYPRQQSGFAFRGVTWSTTQGERDLPTGFTLIFKDGYQRCSS